MNPLILIMGIVVLIAMIVLAVLFLMLGKEGQKDDNVVPMTDLAALKKQLSPGILQPQVNPVKNDEVIPAYVPKISLPTQENKSNLDDALYKQKAKDLEDELRSISQKADSHASHAQQLIETLTKENEALKAQQAKLDEAHQTLTSLEDESTNLKIENGKLETQLETANSKVHLLEEQMTAYKVQVGEELKRADATVKALEEEKQALLTAPKPDPDVALRQEIDSLNTEQSQLKQKTVELEQDVHKLRELNAHLIDKNDLLQYELVKARAQTSGLERVSYNYKNQLEDFFKKIDAVQTTNEHLTQVKNRLEGTVEELKSRLQAQGQQ